MSCWASQSRRACTIFGVSALEVDGATLAVIGVLAGILILVGWVEQVYKGYRSKQLKDVSNYLMMFIGAGAILWIVYGVLVSDVYIIGTNSAALVLMIIVLAMKNRYDSQLKIAKDG